MTVKKVKFLFIRLSSIGDIVLTTPAIRCLHNQMDEAEIHYVTKKQYENILTHNPNIFKIHILKKDINETIKELKSENFDYIIDLHNNLRTARIKSRLKRLSFSFQKLNVKKWLLVNLKINKLPKVHIVDRYLETLKLFDIHNDNKGLDYFIEESEHVLLSNLPEFLNNGFVGFVIGAKHETKKLPIEKIISIINELNYPVVLLGGSEDVSAGDEICRQTTENVFNSCGKYSINQSASIVKQAKLIITHDTGLMHIAAAFKKLIISVWGNTVPEFGMYPYLGSGNADFEKLHIIEKKNLSCRPCSKIGFNKCPKKHFKCMMDINTKEIIDLAKALLQ